eukprot:CAMPEP_0114983510 /NCGR_PEP_ID=MMETSP0216-20121206/6737_1 /TAXON_ID=223996 /ORGANISM="Protocruzia adherens, Strain Boccale" /LENGTH=328 /DNA_ID=CAMNT_0002345495 /DNA_START=1406 /DNA_END=2392 /DNA_ORIENTATION=+
MVLTEPTQNVVDEQLRQRRRRITKLIDRPGMVDNWYSKSTSQALAARSKLFDNHKQARPFKCSFCKKRFAKRHHLTRHETIHMTPQEIEDFRALDSEDDGETLDCDKINEKFMFDEEFKARIQSSANRQNKAKKTYHEESETTRRPEEDTTVTLTGSCDECFHSEPEENDTAMIPEDGIEEGVFQPRYDDDGNDHASTDGDVEESVNYKDLLQTLDKGLEEDTWLAQQIETRGQQDNKNKAVCRPSEVVQTTEIDYIAQLIENFDMPLAFSCRILVAPAEIIDRIDPFELLGKEISPNFDSDNEEDEVAKNENCTRQNEQRCERTIES